MTRKILLRAWDREYKMMVYPKPYYIDKNKSVNQLTKKVAWDHYQIGEVYNQEECEYHQMFMNDERFIPLQSTGLKDKNGKMIFTGDIVEDIGKTYLIESCIGGWECKIIKGASKGTTYVFSCLSKEIEIIGNVFEDKNLLNNLNQTND